MVPLPLVRRARELGERDHRDVQLLGQPLHRTADVGDLLLAALHPALGAHQLQVVDDDQVEPVLGLEPPRLGPDLHRRHRRGVVDVEPRPVVGLEGGDQPVPLFLVEPAGPELVEVDPPLAAQQAVEELLGCHLEREDRDRGALVDRRVLGDVERQRRLAHRGAGGEDDQVASLQPGGVLVELGVAGGEAGDRLALFRHLLDRAQRVVRDALDRDEPAAAAGLLQPEEALHRLVEDLDGGAAGGRRLGPQRVRQVEGLAQERAVVDDPGVDRGVGRPRQAVDQRSDVGRPAGPFERRLAVHLGADRDGVDRFGPPGEGHHGLEDAAVGLAVEVLRVEDLERRVERGRLEQHGPQHGPFGLLVPRKAKIPAPGGRAAGGCLRRCAHDQTVTPPGEDRRTA